MRHVHGDLDSDSKVWALRGNLLRTSIPKDSGRSHKHSYDLILKTMKPVLSYSVDQVSQ